MSMAPNLVPMRTRLRRPPRTSPMNSSDLPLPYMSAVSKKSMPASSAASITLRLASRSIFMPKLLQPSPTRLTSRSELPRRRCSMRHLLRCQRIIRGPVARGGNVPDAIVQREGHSLVITMNRPERFNALSGAMLIRMYDAYQLASRDPEIRCIIVTGAGGNFSSGADLKAMSGDAGNSDPEIDAQKRLAEDPDLPYKADRKSTRLN